MSILAPRMSRIVLAATVSTLSMASAAHADMFTFSYTDPTGLSATGNLVATDNGNGTMSCTSGDITIDAGPVTGTFSLLPGVGTSPNGAFNFNSLLYPGINSLDGQGLVFRDTGTSLEINIWNDGGGEQAYTMYMHLPQSGYFYAQDDNGTFSMAPSVPAPSAAALMGIGMLASARRRRV